MRLMSSKGTVVGSVNQLEHIMYLRDYQEIAQAIWEVDTYDDDSLADHSNNVARSIADVMFNDNPNRFDEEKFMSHATQGVEYDD